MERAAGFDEFARSRRDRDLVRRRHRGELRASHLVPAVDYLQANRIRMRLMQETAHLMEGLDVVVAPYRSINPPTSMIGHPVVAVPNGFHEDGTPTGIAFMGNLYQEGGCWRWPKPARTRRGFTCGIPLSRRNEASDQWIAGDLRLRAVRNLPRSDN